MSSFAQKPDPARLLRGIEDTMREPDIDTSIETTRKKRGRRPPLITPPFVLVVMSTFGYFLCVGVLLPVVPRFIEGPLGGSDIAVGVSVGVFSLTAVLMRPFAGRMGDRRGRRPLMIAGAAIVAATVIAYTIVDTIMLLAIFRLIAGVGEALFFVGAAAAVNDLAPEERRGEAVSLFSLALYGGISFGPILGESLLDGSGYDAVWWSAFICGTIAAVLAIWVRDARPAGPDSGPPPRLVHPAAFLPGLVLATTVWGFSAFNTFVSLYALQLGMSGSRFVFFTYSFTVLLIRLFGARIPDLIGPKRSAMIATITVGVGMLVMTVWGSPAGLYVGAFIFGAGQAFAFPALMILAVRGAAPHERGAVVGTYSAFVDLAFGAGAVSLGPVAHEFGYRGAFAVSAGVAAAGLVLLLARVREPRAPVVGGRPPPPQKVVKSN